MHLKVVGTTYHSQGDATAGNDVTGLRPSATAGTGGATTGPTANDVTVVP